MLLVDILSGRSSKEGVHLYLAVGRSYLHETHGPENPDFVKDFSFYRPAVAIGNTESVGFILPGSNSLPLIISLLELAERSKIAPKPMDAVQFLVTLPSGQGFAAWARVPYARYLSDSLTFIAALEMYRGGTYDYFPDMGKYYEQPSIS